MNCADCEERLSDYLEDALDPVERAEATAHFRTCAVCRDLLADVTDVLEWGRNFSEQEPPPWLAARITANTPDVVRETWRDTVRGAWRWLTEPRTAMAIFAAVLVAAWLGSIAGFSPGISSVAAVVRDPASIYYTGEELANRAYDGVVRSWYRSRLVAEVYFRIEQLKERS